MTPRRVDTPSSSIRCITARWSHDSGEFDAVALPVRARPCGLGGSPRPVDRGQTAMRTPRDTSTLLDNRRESRELHPPDRGLHVGHPEIEPDFRIALENDFAGPVSHRIGHAHRMLPPEAELAIELRARGRDHAAVACGDDLPRVKREAGDVAVRLPDLLPPAIPQNLAAARAGGVLDDRNASAAADLDDAREIARHAELMDAQNRLRARGECRFDQRRVHVVGPGLDVDEDRCRATVPDGVRRRDERVADGDDLVTALPTARSARWSAVVQLDTAHA